MPKRGSILLRFVTDALDGNTYPNLRWCPHEFGTFSLKHVGRNSTNREYFKIYEDYYILKYSGEEELNLNNIPESVIKNRLHCALNNKKGKYIQKKSKTGKMYKYEIIKGYFRQPDSPADSAYYSDFSEMLSPTSSAQTDEMDYQAESIEVLNVSNTLSVTESNSLVDIPNSNNISEGEAFIQPSCSSLQHDNEIINDANMISGNSGKDLLARAVAQINGYENSVMDIPPNKNGIFGASDDETIPNFLPEDIDDDLCEQLMNDHPQLLNECIDEMQNENLLIKSSAIGIGNNFSFRISDGEEMSIPSTIVMEHDMDPLCTDMALDNDLHGNAGNHNFVGNETTVRNNQSEVEIVHDVQVGIQNVAVEDVFNKSSSSIDHNYSSVTIASDLYDNVANQMNDEVTEKPLSFNLDNDTDESNPINNVILDSNVHDDKMMSDDDAQNGVQIVANDMSQSCINMDQNFNFVETDRDNPMAQSDEEGSLKFSLHRGIDGMYKIVFEKTLRQPFQDPFFLELIKLLKKKN